MPDVTPVLVTKASSKIPDAYTADPSPIRVGVLRVQAEHGVSALSRADTVIIPGRGLRPPAAELLAALARACKRAARMVSSCTGAHVLAEAGLLDGHLFGNPHN